MKEKKAVMRESMEAARREVGGHVADYLYPDGRAVVSLALGPAPRGLSVDAYLFDIGEASGWSTFKQGTWFEANLLFSTEGRGAGRAYKTRFHGLQQIQTWATKSPGKLFETLRFKVWPKMQALGYGAPKEFVFRAGVSIDDSRAFKKKDPPGEK
jgi:hypothetical protein